MHDYKISTKLDKIDENVWHSNIQYFRRVSEHDKYANIRIDFLLKLKQILEIMEDRGLFF